MFEFFEKLFPASELNKVELEKKKLEVEMLKAQKNLQENIIEKEDIEILIEKIADKTAKQIADNKQSNPILSELEKVELEKKKLEVEMLKAQKNRPEENIIAKGSIEIEKKKDTLKDKWYKFTSVFRLKVHEEDFKELLLNHKEKLSPQAIQGKWQAYGQMRAGRTTARAVIMATGVGGGLLWIYQQTLSGQIKKIQETAEDVSKERDTRELAGEEHLKIAVSHKMLKSEIDVADDFIKNSLCKGNQNCIEDYENRKAAARNIAKTDNEAYLAEAEAKLKAETEASRRPKI
jgi:hypothetical protein